MSFVHEGPNEGRAEQYSTLRFLSVVKHKAQLLNDECIEQRKKAVKAFVCYFPVMLSFWTSLASPRHSVSRSHALKVLKPG